MLTINKSELYYLLTFQSFSNFTLQLFHIVVILDLDKLFTSVRYARVIQLVSC